jgi:hypothetical protein
MIRREVPMQRSGVVRDLAAFIVVVVACPGALFGGALVSCASQGLTATCALQGIAVSPVILLGAGIVAGLLTAGWGGVGRTVLGLAVGLAVIPLIAGAAGNGVPIDPVQGAIAAMWFGVPLLIGHGLGRGIARLASGRA